MARRVQQFCRRGHDTFLTGRTSSRNCKECGKIDALQYSKSNPLVAKAYLKTSKGRTIQRNSNYKSQGILNLEGNSFTVADYDRALERQHGRCKLKSCSTPPRALTEKEIPLVVDHDHATRKFRGLLCRDCNSNKVGKLTLEDALAVVLYLKNV